MAYKIYNREDAFVAQMAYNMFAKEDTPRICSAAGVNGLTFSMSLQFSNGIQNQYDDRKNTTHFWDTGRGFANGRGYVSPAEMMEKFQEAVDNQWSCKIEVDIRDHNEAIAMPKSAGKNHTSKESTMQHYYIQENDPRYPGPKVPGKDGRGDIDWSKTGPCGTRGSWDCAPEGTPVSYRHKLSCRVKIDQTTGERNETGEKRAKSFVRFMTKWLNENYYNTTTPTPTPTTPTPTTPTPTPGNKMTDDEATQAATRCKKVGVSKSYGLKTLRSKGFKISVARWNDAWNRA